jgi:hypothetical protein
MNGIELRCRRSSTLRHYHAMLSHLATLYQEDDFIYKCSNIRKRPCCKCSPCVIQTRAISNYPLGSLAIVWVIVLVSRRALARGLAPERPFGWSQARQR